MAEQSGAFSNRFPCFWGLPNRHGHYSSRRTPYFYLHPCKSDRQFKGHRPIFGVQPHIMDTYSGADLCSFRFFGGTPPAIFEVQLRREPRKLKALWIRLDAPPRPREEALRDWCSASAWVLVLVI